MIFTGLEQAGYEVHMFEAEALVAILDGSSDLPEGKGMEAFDQLMSTKYQEIPGRLFDDLEIMGIESPVLVDVDADGYWWFADGHHRLAWALEHGGWVPVLFVDDNTDATEIWLILDGANTYYDYA